MREIKDNNRLTIYVPQGQHRKFKSMLAMNGENMSEFFRRVITEYITRYDYHVTQPNTQNNQQPYR